MTILIFALVLALLILTHELGHFLVAKWAGIRVDEFGLGFPPRVWGKKVGETIYSINWIPFGGFVRIFGENPDEESLSGPDAARSMVNKPRWKQAAVLAAGVFCNFLLAWLLFSVGFMYGLPASAGQVREGMLVENASLMVTSVRPDSPAEAAGLKAGDKIVAVNSNSDTVDNLDVENLQQFLATHGNQEVKIKYLRGKEEPGAPASNIFEAKVTPQDGVVEGKPAIGITMDMVGVLKLSFFKALKQGFVFTVELTYATVVGLGDFFAGLFRADKEVLASVAGPVGLVGLVGDAQALGIAYLISFTALISVNLAVLNLIPFPALDGGRLFFLAIEGVIRRRLDPKIINMLNVVGFLLLIGLMVLVTFSDIAKLI